ncbi:MAG: hypothetical protein KAJ92_02520 [Gammaproteobacteria bacterium]|nr:hypothetical protein [Gammaproteobacteria bacterium]MCK5262526.1 hypothetical protein [Gammaproteobacteria bacterium]
MNLYETKIKACAILLSSISVMSCSESTDTQSLNTINNTDPVVTASSKPTVALTSEQVNVTVGETFTLDITMSNFPTSEGGGVTVQFDSTMLNVSNVTINSDVWNFVNKAGEIDNNAGVVSDILFSSFNGISEDSNVATITFIAISSGSSQISLETSSINPFSSNGGEIAANFVSTKVTVN